MCIRDSTYILPLQFFRLRPPNFPTLRLSQLASLYYTHHNLFSKLMVCERLEDMYQLFKIAASQYWHTHYTSQKSSKKSEKALTTSFIDLLVINTVIPLKFSYAKHKGEPVNEQLLELVSAINPESNSIVKGFNTLKYSCKSALESQALVQLKTDYCNKHQCLKCAIGHSLLNK